MLVHFLLSSFWGWAGLGPRPFPVVSCGEAVGPVRQALPPLSSLRGVVRGVCEPVRNTELFQYFPVNFCIFWRHAKLDGPLVLAGITDCGYTRRSACINPKLFGQHEEFHELTVVRQHHFLPILSR